MERAGCGHFFRYLADDGSGIADRSNDRVFAFCRKLYYASSRRGRMQPLLPLSIYQQVMQVFHLPLAAAMSITLLAVVSVVIGILGIFQKRWEARING